MLAEELGRGLLVGRFLVGTVLASQWLAAAPGGARRDRQLEALLGGVRTMAVADAEPAAHGAPGMVSLQARALAPRGGWRLEGGKRGIWSEAGTDGLLVSALDVASGETLLFDVALDARGLLRRDYATVDGGRALDLEFAGVEIDAQALLAGPGRAAASVRRGCAPGISCCWQSRPSASA